FTTTDGDEQMVPNGLNLSGDVTSQNVRERTYRNSLVVRREECRHSGSRKDLLRISHPLQHPIGAQTLVRELQIRRKIFGGFTRRNRITCGMAALTLQFHEQVG